MLKQREDGLYFVVPLEATSELNGRIEITRRLAAYLRKAEKALVTDRPPSSVRVCYFHFMQPRELVTPDATLSSPPPAAATAAPSVPSDSDGSGGSERIAAPAQAPQKHAHVVYRKIDSSTMALQVVVKVVRRGSFEREILQELGGKHHIAALLGASNDPNELLMPFYEDRGVRSFSELARLMADLADALAFLHAAGWVHRDVKRSNVRLTETGAVLIDFDLARRWREGDEPLVGVAGTRGWMAPEVFDEQPYTSSVDVYGLGLVALDELLKLNYGIRGGGTQTELS